MRFYSSSFPADEITKKRWAEALGINPDCIKRNVDKICKAHFSIQQFKYCRGKRLKTDAIPSLQVAVPASQV